MSVSTVQTPPTDLRRLLRATQQKREAVRDSQDASATAATTTGSDTAKPPPDIGKDAAKLVADLKALLIGQQADAGSATTPATAQATASTASTANTATATSDASAPASDARHTGGHHHHHAPPPGVSPAATATPSAATTGASAATSTNTVIPSLAQTLVKALQAYAKGGQATATTTTSLVAA